MFDLLDENVTYQAYREKLKAKDDEEKKAKMIESDGSLSEINHDHAYHKRERETEKARLKSDKKFELDLLYTVCVSGNTKKILNTVPRAVAVLSNSKKLFLDHLNVMFKCLKPQSAELCYIDTDSCIWSLSHTNLEECLKPERMHLWREKNIMACETGPKSCHGKMKLEGLFSGGMFASMKIYRLFQNGRPAESGAEAPALAGQDEVVVEIGGGDDDDDDDDGSRTGFDLESTSAVYTRCKGINRRLAEKIDTSSFDHENSRKTVILRHCLRASKTGEISLLRESRSLAVPFNLKRYVTEEGLHTLPLSENAFN
jgi:hypothetical protein